MDYTEETMDFVAHGFTVYVSNLLGKTEEEHCERLFEFGGLRGWIDGKVVCDVGCGVGGVLSFLRKSLSPSALIGASNCQVQLEAIQSMGMEPHFCDLDEPVLPVADLFIFQQSIGHAKDMPTVIEECERKLKPGGRILINDFAAPYGVVHAPTWGYRAEPVVNFASAAMKNGLEPVRFEIPKTDTSRYLNYWSSSNYMKSKHGSPYVVAAQSALMLFEKGV